MTEEILLPGEEEEEETEQEMDAEFNVGVLEDLRTEFAERARNILGMPDVKSTTVDPDIDTVLMYLASCADFYMADHSMASDDEYTPAVALNDLDILRQAIVQVSTLVRRVETARELRLKYERSTPKRHVIPLANIKDLKSMSATEAAAYSDAMRQASEEVQKALRLMDVRDKKPIAPEPTKPEIQVIRRKRGA